MTVARGGRLPEQIDALVICVANAGLPDIELPHGTEAGNSSRSKLAGAEVPYPLLVDEERRPIGWLSQRDLELELVPARADSPLGPLLDRDDIMRDALADLLQGQAQYAAVVDSRGRIDGVLSVEIISEFLGSPAAEHDEHRATERPHERGASERDLQGR